MSHIAMLLSNAYRPDPRVTREARTLVQARHVVDLYCWDRLGELPENETLEGMRIHRYQAVRSSYGAGWRQLFRLPRFWGWAQEQITRQQPEIVHCHDLDTLYAGVALKRRLHCKLVYDAHEHYPALMTLYLPAALARLLVYWEQALLKNADHIISASSVLADEYRRKTSAPVTVIGNAPSLSDFNENSQHTILQTRSQLGLEAALGVFYIGGFTNNRALLPLIDALDGLDGWQLHLWGDGHQRAAVEQAISGLDNTHYHGWAEAAALPGLFSAADVIYYCLRSDYPGAQYNAPNTLAYAMASSRPLIANMVGDLGRVVTESDCGILLHEVSPATIRQALQELSDPLTRQKLGANGRRAAESRYNWERLAQTLLDLYASLSR
jgi:glycosyltransferase involved in cell wall biosynthesis